MEPFNLSSHPQRRTWLDQVRPRLNVVWRGTWQAGRVQASRICFDHELVVFTSGTTRAVVGDLEFTCQAGDALIQPPGVVQWSQALNGQVERCTFHFDWNHEPAPGPEVPYRFLDQGPVVPGEVKPTPPWVAVALPWFVRGADARLPRLVADVHRALRVATSATALLTAEARFLELLAIVLTGSAAPAAVTPGLALVQAVKTALESDLSTDLDLAAVADAHDVTREHLTRAFARRLGLPPVAYRTGLRLEAARRLLAGGSTVAAAALAVGLADPRYFTRLYTKRFGVPPSRDAGNVHPGGSLQPRPRQGR